MKKFILKEKELNEDFAVGFTQEDSATAIRNLIKCCWDDVDKYTANTHQLEDYGNIEASGVVSTLIKDLYVAIGQLENLLNKVDPKSAVIDMAEPVNVIMPAVAPAPTPVPIVAMEGLSDKDDKELLVETDPDLPDPWGKDAKSIEYDDDSLPDPWGADAKSAEPNDLPDPWGRDAVMESRFREAIQDRKSKTQEYLEDDPEVKKSIADVKKNNENNHIKKTVDVEEECEDCDESLSASDDIKDEDFDGMLESLLKLGD